jgi:hypothetical protein
MPLAWPGRPWSPPHSGTGTGALRVTWPSRPAPCVAGSAAPAALPDRVRPDELGCALEHLGAAAIAMGSRFGLQHTSPWARINVLTRGRLLTMPAPG